MVKKKSKPASDAEIGAMFSHIVKHMATKDDIADVRNEMATGFADIRNEMTAGFADIRNEMTTGFADIRKEMATKDDIAWIRSELKDIKERLDMLEAAVRNQAGYSKEIDHLLRRVAVIERHLKIKPKASA